MKNATETSRRLIGAGVAVVLVLASPATLEADDSADDAAIEFLVQDRQSNDPIDGASVDIESESFEHFTDQNGRVTVDGLPARPLEIEIDFTGYESKDLVADLEADRHLDKSVELTAEAPETDAETDPEAETEPDADEPTTTESVEVTTTGRRVATEDVYRPTTTIEGDELQREMAMSIPQTLDSIPGFNAQFNGPGASSPTIRGLPGDRVLMLEEGHRTGDLYWTASDHGVMSEPLSARRMEVVRGPAGLLYGSNALGGATNVIRDDISPRDLDQWQTTARTQAESVNRGVGAGATLRGPVGPLNFYGEATARRAGDTRTPLGDIDNTGMRVFNAGVGASWLPDWGLAGAAVRHYDNTYEIPGEFDGELIPGGHPGGVTSEARRTTARIQTRYDDDPTGFEELELKSNLTLFNHDEIEATIDGEEALGARFDQTSTDTRLIGRHQWLDVDDGPDAEGAVGLSVQTRDLDAGGASPGTRSGYERDLGLFGYEEMDVSPLHFQLGLRYDFRHVTTDDLSDLTTRTQQRTIVKEVSSRTFPASFSGSFATLVDVADDWRLGANFARAVRHPTIEELYSDGPHLADFSFDIGDPNLNPEVGHGVDLFLRSEQSDFSLEIAGYYNRIDNYIYYSPTGETVRVHREGVEPRTTPVFEARGDDATFVGAEGRIEWNVVRDLTLDASASYTRASRREADDPLPFIPPLSGSLEARWDQGDFFGGIGGELTAAQNRVPRPVEIGDQTSTPQEPTPGYALASAHAGWRFDTADFGHTLTVNVENAADTVWRDHMSRIKEVAPQPGRNIKISYEAMF